MRKPTLVKGTDPKNWMPIRFFKNGLYVRLTNKERTQFENEIRLF